MGQENRSRGAREGLPPWGVRALSGVFALSLLGMLSWFAYFCFAPGIVERLGAGRLLLLMAALSGAVSLSSWLLALHHGRESYGWGEEVFLRACMIVPTGILLFSGLWALGIAVFA